MPIIALTATADEATRADIAPQLFAGNVETLVLGFDRPNIKLSVEARSDGKRQLLDFVRRQPGAAASSIACRARRRRRPRRSCESTAYARWPITPA